MIENVNEVHCKKIKTKGMDYRVHFNDKNADLNVIEEYERTQEMIEKLLEDVTGGAKENDRVRFVLRTPQLNTPISLPFLPVSHLTPERVYAQIERVVQSNQDFVLDDSVIVDIVHVDMPLGSGSIKRHHVNLFDHLKSKKSIVTIRNSDDMCLARALIVAIAKIEKDPKYWLIQDSRSALQKKKAKELHEKAEVPLGQCGIPEVKKFQEDLMAYEINIVSAEHGNIIIHPHTPSKIHEKRIYLYLHNKHYDVINSMPAFFSRSHFCHTCRKAYQSNLEHLCPAMCRLCRSFDCSLEYPVFCEDCNRTSKSQACYDQHKKPIGRGSSVCDGIKKCLQCGRSVQTRQLSKHLCQKVHCKTCKIDVDDCDHHVCYIQKEKVQEDNEETEGTGYKQLFFFDYEARQEDAGVHKVNLCIVHNEAGDEWIFEGEDMNTEFCKWLFTTQNKNCTFLAHNFQGYDGYFIQKFLNKNAMEYNIILRGAKILSLSVPMFNIRFINSLNFIPMALAKFPSTFGIEELSKGYFPHLFNRRENQEYVGPIPCEAYYNTNGMKEKDRTAFLKWHKEQRRANYVFNFREEIIKYCRSDVDILRCCMEFRELFESITNIDPFEKSLTIASACHRVFRTNFLSEDTIAVFQSHEQLKVKQSNTAMKWLSYVYKKEGIHIQHVQNGGEKRVGLTHWMGTIPRRTKHLSFRDVFGMGVESVMLAKQ